MGDAMNVRFAEECREDHLEFLSPERTISEKAIDSPPSHLCQNDIFLGFFFDGTNNNKFRDTPGFAHSNVARLYEAFIGTPAKQKEPKLKPAMVNGRSKEREMFPDKEFLPKGFQVVDFPYYRKVYIPGVGTPFPDVGDSGADGDKTLGLGMAFLGEARLCWAQLQICNQIHAALTGKAIQDDLPFMVPINGLASHAPEAVARLAADYNKALLERIPPMEKQVAQAFDYRKARKPGVRRVRISVFGFSRGAAEARAFVNRVVRYWGNSIAGLPLSIDFLGIFDTVASVGVAQSVPSADGHMEWAAGQNLAIPQAVKRCAHLVSAHEVRASFPLDSVCVAGRLPSNCKEIVYPGVHSDVGGGYPPGDQGRSLGEGAAGDRLKLSQVPLAQMYREARMAGVPLAPKGQFIAARADNFAIDGTLRSDFNAYVEATRTGRVPPTNGKGDADFARLFPTEEQPRHSLDALMTTHYAYFLQWRKPRLRHIHELPGLAKNTNAACKQDIEDCRGADEELEKELAFLESKHADKFATVDDPLMDAIRTRSAPVLGALSNLAGPFSLPAAAGSVAAGNKIEKMLLATMKNKQAQWDSTLRSLWMEEPILKDNVAKDVSRLFECYVHDSRAWFKALLTKDGYDSDGAKAKLLKAVAGVDGYETAPNDEDWFTLGGREQEKAHQKRMLTERLAAQQKAGDITGIDKTRTALADLDAYGPLVRGGREPYRLYGYLRFRRLYQNGSLNAAAYDKRQILIQQDEQSRAKDDRLAQENTRHETERKKILADEHRVIRDGRVKGAQLDEYLYGSKRALEAENRRHEENVKVIEGSA